MLFSLNSAVSISSPRSHCTAPVRTTHNGSLKLSCRCNCSAGNSNCVEQHARVVPLETGATWLLNQFHDQFYSIRGSDFVSKRADASTSFGKTSKRHMRSAPPVPARNGNLHLIRQAIFTYPCSAMLLEGPVVEVDVTEHVEACPEVGHAATAPAPPSVPLAGMVPTCADVQGQDGPEEEHVFYTSSSSPRRTKMIGFTCKCCGARNHNSVNPAAFLRGTLVAQCAKCARWHKLADHLKLFHDLKGPLFPAGGVCMSDLPPSLQPLDPAFFLEMQEGAGSGPCA